MEKKKSHKEEITEFFEELVAKSKQEEYAKSSGSIILHNGMVLPVHKNFYFFRDAMVLYSKASVDESEDLMKIINGGVITNGAITVDVGAIMAAVSNDKKDHFYVEEEVPTDDEGIDEEGIDEEKWKIVEGDSFDFKLFEN
tara:strand:- start:626 stop:1048 length:423 start_codon:yes stop_codon:yes gene_type:complete